MVDKKTKVLYDVSGAIKELEKLNKKVDESGDKANESFEKGGEGASKFDDVLKQLPPGLSSAAGQAKNLLTAIGPAGLVFGAAAAGVLSVTANLLDLKTVLRDTTERYKGLLRAFNAIRQTREDISTFGDVAAQRDLELAQRAVRLDKADLAAAQNLVEIERDAAKQRLSVVRNEIRDRERIVSSGIKREEDLRKRLADRNRTNAADDPRFQGPGRVTRLAAAASQAAFEGNVDLAESLLDAAKAQSAELGNHAFFLRAIESANNNINRELEKQIQTQAKTNQQNQQGIDRLKELEDALAGDLKANEEKLKLILRQNRELSRQVRLIRDAALEQRNQEQADTAARGVQAGALGVTQFFRQGTSSFENFNRTIDDVQQAITGGVRDQQAVDAFQANLIKELKGITQLAARVNRGENVTAADFGEQTRSFKRISRLLEILNQAEAEDRVNESRAKDLERLNEVFGAIRQLFTEGAAFRRVRGDDTAIREGTSGPTRDDMRALRDSILQLKGSLDQPTRAGAAIPPSNQTTSQGAPNATTGAVASNITVNANVKGGIIDAETTREITRIIRQELRKQTSAAPVA